MKGIQKAVLLLLLAGIIAGMLWGCSPAPGRQFQKNEDFAHAKIGVMTGSSQAIIAKEKFPDAKLVYFSRPVDLVLAVEQGKIDCYMLGSPFLAATRWEGAKVRRMEEAVTHGDIAFAFPKNTASDPLRAELDSFLQQAKEDGTIQKLQDKWFGDTEPTEHPDYASLPGENGVIRLAAVAENKPLIYQYQNQCTGIEMELLTLFARQYGYRFEVEIVPFDSVIMGMATGKYDMTSAGLQITPERSESVSFSQPYMQFDVVLVVKDEAALQSIRSPEEVRTLAVMTGTVWDSVAKEEVPQAKIQYYSTTTDLLLALEQGKVDAVLGPKTFYATARWEKVPAAMLNDTFGAIYSGFMLAGEDYDRALLAQLNAFIHQAKQDGTAQALAQKWIGTEEPTEHPDYASLPGENGTLTVAVDQTAKPMVYRKGDRFTGYDVEFLTQFAKSYGYRLEFVGMTFDALLPYVSGGKCDLGACGVGITPERAESVTFTQSYLTIDGVMMVRQNDGASGQTGFWEQLGESFEKTFLREDRWKLIVSGIGVTMLISICAALGGTALGFSVYMLSRCSSAPVRSFVRGVAKVYSRIIAGTPVVVILMILFYVVFGTVRNMSGIVVAIIGFTLTFGAFVYEHMTVAVGSIDPGQTEAAYALGYPKNKAFFRVVFPQAMKLFLPSYCGNAVELIKATAVVGYIAVNDLTKMGDIIRSNTYEAFFPLMATAAIYFLLTWLLSLLLQLLKRRFEPRQRKKEQILKGVKLA